MNYRDRALVGLLLLLASVGLLWFGSPDRIGLDATPPGVIIGFVGLFALGFIIFSMAILGTEDAYPAFLSGLVLYFLVGALFSVFSYFSGSNLVGYSLQDVGNRFFWIEFGRFTALWPLKLVQTLQILGWDHTAL
jgi:hypothetical protein